jgi:hypothetical protein
MKKLMLVTALGLMASVASFGATLCASGNTNGGTYTTNNGGATTLDQNDRLVLDGAGGVCNLGGITFSNFSVYGNSVSAPINGTFSVSVNNDSTGLNFGFPNLGSNDVLFYFQSTPAPPGVKFLAGTTGAATEVVCSTAFSAGTSTCTGTNLFTAAGNGQNGVLTVGNNVGLNPFQTYLIANSPTAYFVKDVSGGSDFQQVYTPEPMTLGLMGAGLLGLGILRRMRKN